MMPCLIISSSHSSHSEPDLPFPFAADGEDDGMAFFDGVEQADSRSVLRFDDGVRGELAVLAGLGWISMLSLFPEFLRPLLGVEGRSTSEQ